jgi:hypothetical protein
VGHKLKFALLGFAALLPAAETPTISWQCWSDKLFEQARRENKFVLLVKVGQALSPGNTRSSGYSAISAEIPPSGRPSGPPNRIPCYLDLTHD